jgi:hypothetical protein
MDGLIGNGFTGAIASAVWSVVGPSQSSSRPGEPTAPIRYQQAQRFVPMQRGRSHSRRRTGHSYQHVSMQRIKPSRWRHTTALQRAETRTGRRQRRP